MVNTCCLGVCLGIVCWNVAFQFSAWSLLVDTGDEDPISLGATWGKWRAPSKASSWAPTEEEEEQVPYDAVVNYDLPGHIFKTSSKAGRSPECFWFYILYESTHSQASAIVLNSVSPYTHTQLKIPKLFAQRTPNRHFPSTISINGCMATWISFCFVVYCGTVSVEFYSH